MVLFAFLDWFCKFLAALLLFLSKLFPTVVLFDPLPLLLFCCTVLFISEFVGVVLGFDSLSTLGAVGIVVILFEKDTCA